MQGPIDPRLLALVPPVRGLILRTGVLQAFITVLVLARGVLIGWVAARVILDRGADWEVLTWPVVALFAAIAVHGVVAARAQRSSSESVGRVVDTLRAKALAALRRRDPRRVQEESAHWREVLTDGTENFRPYLNQFLPSLVAAALATPAALVVVLVADPVSGILALVTVPLIPAFMVLIGKLTAAHTRRRLEVTSALGGQLADLLSGSLTLRVLGATHQPSRQLRSTGRRHEKATMSVLRLAFLSSFALEFLATLAVALVAVSIGLRLVDGNMELTAGLIALIVVPEVYNPIRQVGTNFHAAADGLTAAEEILELLDEDETRPVGHHGRNYLTHCGSPAGVQLTVTDLSVGGRDGTKPENLSFTAEPGKITVLYGDNGSGKSTVFLAVLGALPDDLVTGEITAPPPERTAYLPARPVLVPGSVEDNLVLLGAQRKPATETAGNLWFDVPLKRRLGPQGEGLSAGQSQRLTLARTLARGSGPTLHLLDEPSAHLSPELVEALSTELRRRVAAGHTVVLATHDVRLAAIADEVVYL
ncbi:ABC transporter ATP-binding protein/permease [Corynebacterium lipophiloflavum]|uniref:Thiol reductant ABC exporter, CydD subunit n=1 Tax=Corynebacterium lipophiloflavum (strain ATCC 700352 / DSM 44291 / CCUG 37336 / JCM 10383 / DMMZ 1944) TaxID=525263 RepID=C0XR40_CORLD|nr:ATP-binding cassette domain-containing protein [Corynebacterium lipophiloflavum]EEI17283.1 putative thiol reductant ABC exporter, CydD subunit [Corynebacterium lipophiloflavum DSM 44291]